jgi:hypothetical protein
MSPTTLLVDDTRLFKDGRPARVARTSSEAVDLLNALAGARIDELWLDYDLLFGDTVQPFVDHLVALAQNGDAPDIGRICVHTSQIRAGHQLVIDLNAAGYNTVRSYAANMWVRNRAPLTPAQLASQPRDTSP